MYQKAVREYLETALGGKVSKVKMTDLLVALVQSESKATELWAT